MNRRGFVFSLLAGLGLARIASANKVVLKFHPDAFAQGLSGEELVQRDLRRILNKTERALQRACPQAKVRKSKHSSIGVGEWWSEVRLLYPTTPKALHEAVAVLAEDARQRGVVEFLNPGLFALSTPQCYVQRSGRALVEYLPPISTPELLHVREVPSVCIMWLGKVGRVAS
jgi:hypothetical protein